MDDTAILLFVRNPEKEAKVKPLCQKGAYAQNKQLINHLNQHVQQIIKGTGLPFFIHYSEDQVGEDFGERFTNAFGRIFDKGYKRVMALGNDHPGLTKSRLREAIGKLRHYNHVIGPASDGGLYLIGLHRSQFNARAFGQLPWQTGSLWKAYKQAFTSVYSGLPVLRDLDNAYQLRRFLHQYPSQGYPNGRLIEFLRAIAASFSVNQVIPQNLFGNSFYFLPFSLRGPPGITP